MDTLPDNFPDVVRIETVGLCNFRCIHCPTGIQPNNRQVLSENSFDYILAQFTSRNFIPRVVVLYHGGEPLLNKKLPLFIRRLKSIGVSKTSITTNASLLDEKRGRELIEAGLDEIKVSFDGESPDENNKIRQKGDFETNAANVKKLFQTRKELGVNHPHIAIRNTRICSEPTLNALYQKQAFVFNKPPAYLKEYFQDELEEVDFRSFPAMVWPGYQMSGDFEAVSFEREKPKYCASLFETITILSNGNIVLCCYDLKGELILGNVFEKNIFDIWNSGPYAKIRENFRRQKYTALCRKCSIVTPYYLRKR